MQSEHSHNKQALAAFTIIILITSFAVALAFGIIPKSIIPKSILPGFQGMQNGIYGYQVRGAQSVSLGNALPSPNSCWRYNWLGSPTIGSGAVQASSQYGWTCPINVQDSVVFDAQTNPVSANNPYTVGQKVSYYVKNPSDPTHYMIVLGQVNVYTFNVDVSVQSGSSGQWNFGGDTIWYNLYSQTWNQASSLPSNSSVSGNAFEAPLYGVVTNVQWQNQGSNGLSLSVNGAALSFYSSPSTTGQTLATLAGQTFNPQTTNVNSSLSSIYAPDSRLQRLVYYPITLQSFKANPSVGSDCTFGCSYPSVTLTITLYTLQIGEYILTNPSTTNLSSRNQGCTGLGCVSQYFGGLADWLAKPFNQLLVGLLGLFGGGIAVVVLIAVFATPIVVALIYVFSSRQKGKQG